MRILFATGVIPFAHATGGDVISHSILRGLEQLGCGVIIAGYLRLSDRWPNEPDVLVVGRRHIETASARLPAIGWMIKAVIWGWPYTSAKFYTCNFGPLVRRSIESEHIDAVVVDHTQLGWLLAWVPAHVPVAVIMHNAESDFYERASLRQRSLLRRVLYRREARRLSVLEDRIALRADRIWTLSDHDRISMLATADAPKAIVLPVVPEDSAERYFHDESQFDVGLIGTWSWYPNAEALRWFFDEVYPRLPDGLSIHIAGAGADNVGRVAPNIVFRGHVPDAASFMRSARIFVSATRFGTGLETKMLMAISAGCRTVGTVTSVRGLGPLPSSVSISDDARQFAKLIVDNLGQAVTGEMQAESRAWCESRRMRFMSALAGELKCLTAKTRTHKRMFPVPLGVQDRK